jgi:hypothetical protein
MPPIYVIDDGGDLSGSCPGSFSPWIKVLKYSLHRRLRKAQETVCA